MGKYSVRGWQYWPDRREGQYRTQELNIIARPKRNAIIYDSTKSRLREENSEGGKKRKEKGRKKNCQHWDSNRGCFVPQSADLTAPPPGDEAR